MEEVALLSSWLRGMPQLLGGIPGKDMSQLSMDSGWEEALRIEKLHTGDNPLWMDDPAGSGVLNGRGTLVGRCPS